MSHRDTCTQVYVLPRDTCHTGTLATQGHVRPGICATQGHVHSGTRVTQGHVSPMGHASHRHMCRPWDKGQRSYMIICFIGKPQGKYRRKCNNNSRVHRGADNSLAFLISHFPIYSTSKIIFLGWIKEVRTTKS
jgi:hypothetical protein